jgi:segregation and condensation protein B
VDDDQQRRIVEAVILASPEPISAARIAELIPRCNPTQVRAHVKALCENYVEDRRAFEIWEVAGGYQFRSLAEFAPYLKQIQKTRPLRLSQAALETLAVVAYRQPVTRAEVEHVRGVDGGAVLRSLLERDLVRIAGHREVAGRPIVYATSRRFLEVFGLPKLADLPNLRDVEALSPRPATALPRRTARPARRRPTRKRTRLPSLRSRVAATAQRVRSPPRRRPRRRAPRTDTAPPAAFERRRAAVAEDPRDGRRGFPSRRGGADSRGARVRERRDRPPGPIGGSVP